MKSCYYGKNSVYARIDPAYNAIDMFFKQIVLKKDFLLKYGYRMKNLSAWERLVKKN